MSTYRRLLEGAKGQFLFLLGNEAIARGAIEAGLSTATTYPGTPSSEVGDVLYELAGETGIHFEFSVNEKVALESAFASSIAGLSSFVFMKHVGLNVASDSLMSIAYTGVKGPMVIMTADDPSMFSSQNEQDNRHYADIAHLPLIEPSNPQEAKDFLIAAFEISRKEGLPVLFRTTTRISHTRGNVKLGPIMPGERKGTVEKPGRSFVTLPSNGYHFKEVLIRKMDEIRGNSYMMILNRMEGDRKSTHGIITSGEAYNVVRDVLNKLNLDIEILKLGFTNPFPENMVSDFISRHSNIIVVEEVDPIMEIKTRSVAQVNGFDVEIIGKMSGIIPYSHECSPDSLMEAFSKIFGLDYTKKEVRMARQDLPPRPPVLCPGCPHRGTYYSVKRAVKMLKINDVIYSSDIGCYSLGNYEPFSEADVLLSMGSSIGVASGFTKATGQRVIAFIGDSTFFHAGIPALINAVHNNSRMLLVIMDNDVTAMTGRQPNPGTPDQLKLAPSGRVSIEKIVEAIGVPYLKIVDPYDLKETLGAVMEGLKGDGVSVVIARRECAIIRDSRKHREGESVKYRVAPKKCSACLNCVEHFACPALSISGGKISIDPVLCDGCGVCSEPYVCPFQAIEVIPVAI
ncbi:MAG: indolepyruvate ferredoxin oxidoreductase subunit alpha [Candidatus Thermoplasmatota archaeon]|nr:indolepyruvate ferredoxin oxidoreductase subunit alpha [Candidatus Thermoplasmatota archaeon]